MTQSESNAPIFEICPFSGLTCGRQCHKHLWVEWMCVVGGCLYGHKIALKFALHKSKCAKVN
jgi:hypothetical protein